MGERDGLGFSTEDWTRKLRDQARDSRAYRRKLYDRVGLGDCQRVLDVGCGTGAITVELAELAAGRVVGVDIDDSKLERAREAFGHVGNLEFRHGDAQDLPFPDGTFDLVTFTIVLVYVPDQERALREMARVTRPGGHVLATLEPDYASWIEYPPGEVVGRFLDQMRAMGGDLETGRKLKWLFSRAGLVTEVGMDTQDDYVYQARDARRLERFDQDRWVFKRLLTGAGRSEEEADRSIDEERARIEAGLSFNFMPAFFAIGRKP